MAVYHTLSHTEYIQCMAIPGFQGCPLTREHKCGNIMRILQFCKAKLSYGRHTKAVQLEPYKSSRCMYAEPYERCTKAVHPAIQSNTLYGRVTYKSRIAVRQKNPPSKPGKRKKKAGILGGQEQKNVVVNGGRWM